MASSKKPFHTGSCSLTQVVRVSPNAPQDFGKYEWDGSINPNYVEPLGAKKHGKKKIYVNR
jgi:hypothetical protein